MSVRIMDFSVGAHLSLAFPDFPGHHNTNRFEGNNMRESPLHGSRGIPLCTQVLVADKKYPETGVVGLYGALRYPRNFYHIFYQSLLSSASRLLRARYIPKFPPYHTSLPSPGHVVTLTSAKDRVSEQLRNEKA